MEDPLKKLTESDDPDLNPGDVCTTHLFRMNLIPSKDFMVFAASPGKNMVFVYLGETPSNASVNALWIINRLEEMGWHKETSDEPRNPD